MDASVDVDGMTIFAIPLTNVLFWMQFTGSSVSYVNCWIRHVRQNDMRPCRKRIRDVIRYTTPTLSIPIHKGNANHRYGSISTFRTTGISSTNTDSSVYECFLTESEISKLPRLYVGKVPLQPVVVTNISDLANAHTTKNNEIEIPPLQSRSMIQLSDDQAHYVLTVLRMFRKTSTSIDKTNANSPQIRVFANGEEWLADLVVLEPTASTATSKQNQRRSNMDHPVVICRKRLGSLVQQYETQPPIHCWLCVAPPKNKDRVRWMVEKTTELDCTGYIFVDTDYSEETTDDYQKKKFPKMQAYCVEAAEQCERLNLPLFTSVAVRDEKLCTTFTNNPMENDFLTDAPSITKINDLLKVWSEQADNGVSLLVCRERYNTMSVWDALEKINESNQPMDDNDTTTATLSPNRCATKAVVFLIGPEGGWSPSEQRMFDLLERDFPAGIYNVALSRTILRTETAVMTAMSTFAIHRNYRRIHQQNSRTDKSEVESNHDTM